MHSHHKKVQVLVGFYSPRLCGVVVLRLCGVVVLSGTRELRTHLSVPAEASVSVFQRFSLALCVCVHAASKG